MSSVRDVVFGQVRSSYFTDHEGAAKAERFFLDVRRGVRRRRNLDRLLRHHSEEPISDAETWTRDHFDFLIGYFSMVEVGCIAACMPFPLPRSHCRLAKRFLGHRAVRRYYEEHYRLLLPALHLQRCTGQSTTGWDRDAPPDFETFASFFAQSLPTNREEGSLETFLWFLDGGARGDADLEDTLTVLASPARIARQMSAPFDEEDHLALSVRGFTEFLVFCIALDQLLAACEDEILQSAMWHHHAYWFSRIDGEWGPALRTAIENVARWQTRLAAKVDAESRAGFRAAQDDIRAAAAALAHLGSGRYAWRLSEIAALGSSQSPVRSS